MMPEDMPKNVWRWLHKHSSPFLFIRAPGILADYMFLDDDPEAVEVVVEAYREFDRQRYLKKKKEEKPKKPKLTS